MGIIKEAAKDAFNKSFVTNACFELINYKWVDYNLYSYSEWNNLLRKHPELEEFILKEKNFVKS